MRGMIESCSIVGREIIFIYKMGLQDFSGNIKPYINDKKKFIHIHIPKTGGTSLSSMVRTTGGHCRLNDMIKVGVDISKYYKFTMVRNPFSRLVSFYHGSGIQKKDGVYWVKFLSKYKNFEHFVLECLPTYEHGSGMTHIEPQTDWITNEEGVISMDYIGRFERFDESCREILNKVGIGVNIAHLNGSKHGDYRNYYNDKMIDVMNTFYDTDLSNFGYKYE